MSDSDDHRDVESDTAVKTAKRRGRGRKRTPSKVVSKSKKLKQNETSEDLLAKDEVPVQEMPPCSVAQPTFTMPQLPQTVTQPPQPAPQHAHTIPQHTQAVPQPLQTVPPSPHIVPQHSHANFQPRHMVPDHPHTVPLHPHAIPQLSLSLPQPRQAGPQPSYTVPPHIHAVPQPQLPHAVPQPQHAVPQNPQAGLQSPHTVPQNPQAGLQPPQTVPRHPYTIPHPPHLVHQPPHSGPQPSNTVPQHPQAAPPSSVPGSIEGVSLPTFFQFTMPSNVYPSPVLNSTLQTPLQQAVPSSLTAPHSSTMSLLSALQDDKLALILPVLVRMEHKIDQIMAMMGAKSSTGVNGLQVGNQLNATPVGNQSSATVIESQSSATSVESLQSNVPLRNQSNATTSVRNQSNATTSVRNQSNTTTSVRNQSNARAVKNQSSVTATRNRLTETVVRNQLNFATTETQKNATTRNQSTANTVSTSQSNTGTSATPLNTPDSEPAATNGESAATDGEPASHPAEMETQSSAASAETHLTDTTVENGEKADTVMEYQLSGLTPLLSGSFDASKSLPGISARQRMQLEMAKITEQTLPDDLNFPISRDNLIALQARSNSTMNFAVRLLRELFTPDELFGRNISGVRGKDQVDPTRVEMIKEILFKIYRTSPADKELLWRYCRKAMDSFLRKMQRPGVAEEQN